MGTIKVFVDDNGDVLSSSPEQLKILPFNICQVSGRNSRHTVLGINLTRMALPQTNRMGVLSMYSMSQPISLLLKQFRNFYLLHSYITTLAFLPGVLPCSKALIILIFENPALANTRNAITVTLV